MTTYQIPPLPFSIQDDTAHPVVVDIVAVFPIAADFPGEHAGAYMVVLCEDFQYRIVIDTPQFTYPITTTTHENRSEALSTLLAGAV